MMSTVQNPTSPAAIRVAYAALAWAVVFLVLNIYWYAGGSFANPGTLPDPTPDSVAGWVFEVLITAAFPVGIWVCLAIGRRRRRGPRMRRVIGFLAWFGCALLGARGCAGVIDDVTRAIGVLPNGLTGLSLQQAIGTAHPSAYLRWSGYGIDAYFVVGGVLFGLMAYRYTHRRPGRALEHAGANREIPPAGPPNVGGLNSGPAGSRSPDS